MTAENHSSTESQTAPSDQGAPEQSAPEQAAPPQASKPPAAPQIDSQTQSEIDEAMLALGLETRPQQESSRTVKPASGASKPAIKGPRVVQGGREHRSGVVVSVGESDVFIEFGPKELGIVDRQQFKTEESLPTVGQQLEVIVQRFDPNESIFVCAVPGTVSKADWELLQPGQVVEARVTGTNKGGLELEVAGHRAFMPASQVSMDRITDLSVFVGEKMECEVQRIDRRGSGNIVLSRRELLAKERAEQAEKLKGNLEVGQTVEGTVRKLMPFGAFIDIGGVDGLVHIDDLSHERVGHGEKNVERFIKAGDKVKVQILKLDWDANRISLGMKQLMDDPFQTVASDIVEGAEVTGRVTRIAEFGCFVEVQPGIEGLVHISELEWRRVNHPGDVVKQDEVVKAKVLKVDPETRRISLSIKQTKEAPAAPQGKGGRGRRGRGEVDNRSPEEIQKETPAFRRLREQGKQNNKPGGLGEGGGMGMGLGDLKL